jgi:16S rRNA (guanine527-N7)-methyltransferase
MSARTEFEKNLHESVGRLGLALEPRQTETLWRHYELLIDANRQFNLTRITDPAEAALKHYADSLALVAWAAGSIEGRGAPGGGTLVLDVGMGGGFPCVPAAVMRPDWVVIALDKTAKKVRFVQRCAEELGLESLRAVHGRVPNWVPETLVDLAVFRAVSATKNALAGTGALVRPGGRVVCFKTAAMPAAEMDDARRWADEHGWSGPEHFDYTLHEGEQSTPRRLVVFTRGS